MRRRRFTPGEAARLHEAPGQSRPQLTAAMGKVPIRGPEYLAAEAVTDAIDGLTAKGAVRDTVMSRSLKPAILLQRIWRRRFGLKVPDPGSSLEQGNIHWLRPVAELLPLNQRVQGSNPGTPATTNQLRTKRNLVQNIGLHDALMCATTLTRAHPVLTDLTRVCTHLAGSLELTPLDQRVERSNPCTLVSHFTSSTRRLDPA
jgi:hypothetical protein